MRAHGMGSYRLLRKPDYWQLRYRKVSRGFRGTEPQARTALGRLVIEVEAGVAARPASAGGRVGDLLDRHMKHLQIIGRSPATLRGYDTCVKSLKAHIGDVLLADLTPAVIDAMQARMLATGVKPRTVLHRRAVLSGALKQAVRWQLLAISPMPASTPPAAEKTKVRPPTAGRVGELMAGALEQSPPFGLLVRLLAATGCRRGEVCALRWSDIDGPAVVISRALVEDGEQRVIEKDTKSHQIRRVELDVVTLEALEAWRLQAVAWAASCGVTMADDGFIVSDDPAGVVPWRPGRLSDSWRRLCKAEGVHVRLHDLRHWHISELLTGGLPAHEVAYRAGHHPSVTLSTYGHVIRSGSKAAGLIGERLAGA